MNRKQLLAGAAVCVVILWAVFAAGGVRLGSDAAPAPGTTAQTAGSALAAQPLVAGAAGQPANAGVAVLAQSQPAVAQGNAVAQPTAPTQPTALPATATPPALAAPATSDEDAETPEAGETAETPEPGEAAETPEAAEAAETPEAAETAETPEPGKAAEHDGDKVEQGATGGADSDNDSEDQDHDSADGQALAAQARITQQQAAQAALAANRGTTVVKTELDEKDGTVLYKVKLSNGAKVKVNAVTGAILSTDPPESDDSND